MSLPPQDQIERWKKKHGKVYSTSIVDIDFVFRALTFKEFESSMGNSIETEEAVVENGLLHPLGVDFDKKPAGVVRTLADEILEVSGFGDPQTSRNMLEEARAKTQSVWGMMKSFVLATMPSYRDEELDLMDFRELAKKVALAEQIIRVNQVAFGMEATGMKLDLIDPEEEIEKEVMQTMKHTAQKKPGQAGYNDPIARKLQEAFNGG